MSDKTSSLMQLVKQDPRYSLEAYEFIEDSLAYAADSMELGSYSSEDFGSESEKTKTRHERHLTGQELCEAIRQFALNQYGYMSRVVLNRWGLHSTEDFGEVVYNMINIGLMQKSSNDQKSHFEGVFDFDTAFEDEFEMCHVSGSRRTS